MTQPTNRIAVFIDGSNIYAASKALGFDLDYAKLTSHLSTMGDVRKMSYYTALLENEEFSPIRPLMDWLDYNGYDVVTKPAKEFTDSMGRKKIKGNMDTEIIIDAMVMADHVDDIILFTGDGDLAPLAKHLKSKGVRVTVVSTIKSQPPICADDLRRSATRFIDLQDLETALARPERPERASYGVAAE